MFRTMNEEEEPKLASERALKSAGREVFSYGSSLVRFAKGYHELKLLEMEGELPEKCEAEVSQYGTILKFSFIQEPNEPEVWKTFYQRLRKNGWTRRNPAQSQQTTLTMFLYKGDEEDPISCEFVVSFPLCRMELVETIKEIVKKPIYKIVCEGPELVDPEPQPEPLSIPETTPIDPSYSSATLPPDDEIPF